MQLAIIGGGAAAVCLLDALAQSQEPVGVTVYERSSRLWRGRPYQPDLAEIRANAPPNEMSIRAGDSQHFERWLDERSRPGVADATPDPWSGEVFVPRTVYGEYLEHAANAAIAKLHAHGGWVEVVRATVTSVRAVASGVRLGTTPGAGRTVDHAVLCVGGDSPADCYGLSGTPGFVADPYPTNRHLAGVRPDQDVAVLGTGLTGIDAVMALVARGHRGSIAMVSRCATLPTVRQRHVAHTLRHFTPQRLRAWARERRKVRLEELAELMRAELVCAGQTVTDTAAEIFSTEIDDPIDRLRRHVAAVDSAARGLRILQRAVPDSGQDVWHVLSDAGRDAVMEQHLRTVMSLCCPMPPQTAATLLELVDTGQLQIVPGVRAVEARTGGGFAIHAEQTLKTDWAINAVSAPAHRIPGKSSPLVSSLVAAGAAEYHPHGGLAIDRETSRLTVRGEPTHRLFALGDLTFGSLFFTFGIPVLVDRAVDIAHAVVTSAPSNLSGSSQREEDEYVPQSVRRIDSHAGDAEFAGVSGRH